MDIVYSDHAEASIVERRFDRQIIEIAITEPDEIVDGNYGRKIAHKRFGQRVMRIVFKDEGNVRIIITIYFGMAKKYMVK